MKSFKKVLVAGIMCFVGMTNIHAAALPFSISCTYPSKDVEGIRLGEKAKCFLEITDTSIREFSFLFADSTYYSINSKAYTNCYGGDATTDSTIYRFTCKSADKSLKEAGNVADGSKIGVYFDVVSNTAAVADISFNFNSSSINNTHSTYYVDSKGTRHEFVSTETGFKLKLLGTSTATDTNTSNISKLSNTINTVNNKVNNVTKDVDGLKKSVGNVTNEVADLKKSGNGTVETNQTIQPPAASNPETPSAENSGSGSGSAGGASAQGSKTNPNTGAFVSVGALSLAGVISLVFIRVLSKRSKFI